MNKEKLLMMFEKNKDKIVIIFTFFLSFLVLGFCGYRSFRLLNEKDEEIVRVGNLQYKAKNIPKFARQDFLLFAQQLDVDEKKAFKIKKVDRQNIERNIKILKDQGIWDGLIFGLKGISFEEYYRSFQDSQKAFQLQLDELLKKVENKEDLESFREELEKLRQKHSEDIDVFVDFAKEIQEEAQKPIPFFATWIGIGISVAICLIVTFILTVATQKNGKIKAILDAADKKPSLKKVLPETIREQVLDYLFCFLTFCFFAVYLPLQFIIFPLLNCLLSLKISSFRETYKHYFYNKFKTFSLFMTPVIWAIMMLLTHGLSYGCLKLYYKFCNCNENKLNNYVAEEYKRLIVENGETLAKEAEEKMHKINRDKEKVIAKVNDINIIDNKDDVIIDENKPKNDNELNNRIDFNNNNKLNEDEIIDNSEEKPVEEKKDNEEPKINNEINPNNIHTEHVENNGEENQHNDNQPSPEEVKV